MEKSTARVPAIAWLRVTDYMHGWMQKELSGNYKVKEQNVVCLQHLPGAKEVLRMETVEDMMARERIVNAMSATRKNCMDAGMEIDAEAMEQMFGMTREVMHLFVPVECPKMCMTHFGVLRPWTLNVCFGPRQATALQRLIRDEFWKAVAAFDRQFAAEQGGAHYPAKDMIEEFCIDTHTPDMYVDALRHEWQRRKRRMKKGK